MFAGKAITLLARIRIGWKGLPGANTLAYLAHSLIMTVKAFLAFAIA
jgi:hypothetical protein